uniref:DNA-binding protein n=1 Tax=Streptomyces arginensis TaxID=1295550 RepID=M1RY67_STREL|nr:hypothetical protein [Streptomyces arginensis]
MSRSVCHETAPADPGVNLRQLRFSPPGCKQADEERGHGIDTWEVSDSGHRRSRPGCYVKVGRHVRIPESAVEEFVQSRMVEPLRRPRPRYRRVA